MSQPSATTACIGLRAKTARAIAVVLAGTAASPRAVIRTEITLASPANPALFQPYHEVMDFPWGRAIAAVQNAERAQKAAAMAAWIGLAAATRSERKSDVRGKTT